MAMRCCVTLTEHIAYLLIVALTFRTPTWPYNQSFPTAGCLQSDKMNKGCKSAKCLMLVVSVGELKHLQLLVIFKFKSTA